MTLEAQETFVKTTMQDDPLDFESTTKVTCNSDALDTTMQDNPLDFKSFFTYDKRDASPGIEEGLDFPGDVAFRLPQTPEQCQRPEAEPESWQRALEPAYTPQGSFLESGEVQAADLASSKLEGIDYSNAPFNTADEVVQAITEALASGEHGLARKLAMDGTEQYPRHKPLQKFAHILAPPTVARSSRAPRPGIKANRQWLKANREAYIGRWVALRDGHLLSSAHTFDDLIASVDNITDVLLTKL